MGLYFAFMDALLRRSFKWQVWRLDSNYPYLGLVRFHNVHRAYAFYPHQQRRKPKVAFLLAEELQEVLDFVQAVNALRVAGRLDEDNVQRYLRSHLRGTETLGLVESEVKLEQGR